MITMFSMITVAAKNLIAGRIAVVLEPFIKLCSVVKEPAFSSELSTVVLDVVKGQKEAFLLTTTGATISAIGVNGSVLKPVVVGEGVLFTLFRVVFGPLCSAFGSLFGMCPGVFGVILFKVFLGPFRPIMPVLLKTFRTLPTMPLLLVFRLMAFGTSLNHGVTSIIKSIIDYMDNVKRKAQRPERNLVGPSGPKRLAPRTGDDMVCTWLRSQAVSCGTV